MKCLGFIRFDKRKWLNRFLDGEISFSCAANYIKHAEKNGNTDRGDKLEGVFAKYKKGNNNIKKYKKKFGDDLEEIPEGEFVWLRRKSTLQVPVFCIYTITEDMFNVSQKCDGQIKIEMTFPAEMYQGFEEQDETCSVFVQAEPFISAIAKACNDEKITHYKKYVNYEKKDTANFEIEPVTDDEYFTDDIVARTEEFVKKVYGAKTLEENLKFIADALGNKGDSPREAIRNYYLSDFYKDHLKTYQKRPIYWQFDSGKQNGFKCLTYLHRYDRDTVSRVRTDYVHEQQERLRTQLDDAQKTAQAGEGRQRTNAAKRAQKLEKQLNEVNKYEEIVHHHADMRMEIDLDDGVKVNYAKLGELLTKIK